jgi:hypothetical protein
LNWKIRTLLDVLLQVGQASLNELLLVGIDLANRVDLLHTVGAKLDLGGKEVDALVFVERAVDEGGLNDTFYTLGGLEQRLGEASASEGHGEGSRASAILGLNNLITTKLDAVYEFIKGSAFDVRVVGLGKQRDDGDTGVSTNDGDVLIRRIGLLHLGDEARRTDNIQSGHTEETLGVVDTLALEDLGDDWDSGVNLRLKSAIRIFWLSMMT